MQYARMFTQDVRLKKFEDRGAKVDRIEQQRAMYCGAACAAMVAGRYQVVCDQAEAYAKIHDPQRFAVEKLYSDPLGLAAFLHDVLPSQVTDNSVVTVTGTFDEILNAVVHSLTFAEFPPTVLAQAGNHWIVCDGVRLLIDTEGGQECTGLFFENPWFNQAAAYTFHPIDEVKERWLTPIQWGITWASKYAVIAAPPPSAAVAKARSLTLSGAFTAMAAPPDPISIAVSLSTLHGFASAPIAGGGALVSAPLLVRAEDGSGDYFVVPLDAGADRVFNDFVYVAVSVDGVRMHEMTRLQVGLQIPKDAEAETMVRATFPAAQIIIDRDYYWRNDYRCMSRFAVYRRASVDGAGYRLFANGELISDSSAASPAGG